MKKYTIKNITTGEAYIAHNDENLCSFVEEQLYILWELTPFANRVTWTYPFLRGEKVKFTYHRCEFVKVWIDKTDTIYVEEIPWGRQN